MYGAQMIAEGESSHNPVHENRLLTKALFNVPLLSPSHNMSPINSLVSFVVEPSSCSSRLTADRDQAIVGAQEDASGGDRG
jgi:hypothetical protein